MPNIALVQNDDTDVAVRDALSCFDLAAVLGGKLVAIKPNDTWASKDDTSAVTQGDTLRAVIRMVKAAGPRAIVVSGGAGAAETDEVFRLSGMMNVIEEERVEFFDHNKPPFIEVPLRGLAKTVMVSSRIPEYEALIVLSQLKVHESATVTLALKNIAMSFPAADYYGHPRGSFEGGHYFFDDLHSFIAAMAVAFQITLAVTVGQPAMVATGPIGGHCVNTGLLIASDDALAADVVGARLLGFKLSAVRHLEEASKLALGETEIERMTFPRLALEAAVAIFTERVYGHRLNFEHP